MRVSDVPEVDSAVSRGLEGLRVVTWGSPGGLSSEVEDAVDGCTAFTRRVYEELVSRSKRSEERNR
jgi:hypothetical protein